MKNDGEPKRKWYSLRAGILDISSRQLGTTTLFFIFLTVGFLVLAQFLPPSDRAAFLGSTIPIFIGVILSHGSVWLHKLFRPDNPNFQGYTTRRFIQESIYGVVIVSFILGTWILLYAVGYSQEDIVRGFAIAGFGLLLLTLVVYATFTIKNRNADSSDTDKEEGS